MGVNLSSDPLDVHRGLRFRHCCAGEGRQGDRETGRQGDLQAGNASPCLPVSLSPCLPSTRAFSLVELLVLIGIAVILLSIFVPYIVKLRESDHRARCAENLRTLMAALRNYSAANKGAYPRVRYDAVHNPNGYVAFSGASAANPFSPDTSVLPND